MPCLRIAVYTGTQTIIKRAIRLYSREAFLLGHMRNNQASTNVILFSNQTRTLSTTLTLNVFIRPIMMLETSKRRITFLSLIFLDFTLGNL